MTLEDAHLRLLVDRAMEIPQQRQTQASLVNQLLATKIAANRLGFYDAADTITLLIDKKLAKGDV